MIINFSKIKVCKDCPFYQSRFLLADRCSLLKKSLKGITVFKEKASWCRVTGTIIRKKKKGDKNLKRHGRKYSIDEVLKHTLFVNKENGKKSKVDFEGNLINMASDRYKCFKKTGTRCVSCGIEAEFFALERYEFNDKDKVKEMHFNLYAVQKGEDVLMTKDHIIPKSKGGKNLISNYQTMCAACNTKKGSN